MKILRWILPLIAALAMIAGIILTWDSMAMIIFGMGLLAVLPLTWRMRYMKRNESEFTDDN